MFGVINEDKDDEDFKFSEIPQSLFTCFSFCFWYDIIVMLLLSNIKIIVQHFVNQWAQMQLIYLITIINIILSHPTKNKQNKYLYFNYASKILMVGAKIWIFNLLVKNTIDLHFNDGIKLIFVLLVELLFV